MMLQNYWRIAWRFLIRNKIFTAIHVLGLSLGICGCTVLYLIAHFELSFDKGRPDGDRIYRIVGTAHRPDGQEAFMNSPYSDVAGFETQISGFGALAIAMLTVGFQAAKTAMANPVEFLRSE